MGNAAKLEKSSGAVIFIIENGKILYLMLKYPSYWGFAKGNIEENESDEQTAIREIKEETGLKELYFLPGFKEKTAWFYKFKGELRRKEAVFFLGETKNKNVKISSEHEDYKWASYEEALKLIRIKNNKQMLERADNFIKNYVKQKRL